MNLFKNMRSTLTSFNECRCTFDAAGLKEMRVLKTCVICGRAKMFGKMIKCDACHRFAHRRCILGALNTCQRDKDLNGRVHMAPGNPRKDVYAYTIPQSSPATSIVSSDDESIYADCCSQIAETPCHVASGGKAVYVDGWTQTSVTSCHVASGGETVYVDDFAEVGNVTVVTMATEVILDKKLPSNMPPAIGAIVSTVPSRPNLDPRQSNVNTPVSDLSRSFNYWKLRHSLFSKFDYGIMLDEESMFSVCPEVLAQHMAKRCPFESVLDPFCGAGGNAIQLAFTCDHVIAIDSDPNKIMLARRNAEIYGVADRIEFKVGDPYQLASGLRVDAVVTSPPWGGPGYQTAATFDARDLGSCGSCGAGGMASLLRMLHAVSPRVVLHVPKNIDQIQCLKMALTHGFGHIQYESITIDLHPNSLNLYLARDDSVEPGCPIQSFRTVNLKTQPSFGMQKLPRMRNDNITSYASYIDSVTRFLAASSET